ncbi:two-component sensor histidine kinase [Labrys miyagiensis]|uniref:histidine kinase n=1 Tax=Labrys miyagiensis TaxID=346912 RepID=A0ABQ6CP99_9HYPH|nr:HAMP domain-containing sensor histidine kinase [Labrys miyagiensis]GLS20046.1 two-component sensor histidine kinase [Labrys miyagiensis]
MKAPILALKDAVKARWPALRLRSILLGVLLFTALMPGLGAIFLRVYENVLVRQTEAELIAQGAAYDAAFDLAWPGPKQAQPQPPTVDDSYSMVRREASPADNYYTPEPLTIDLNTMPILVQRPQPIDTPLQPDPEALASARQIEPLIAETRRTTLVGAVILDAQGVVLSPSSLSGKSYAYLPEVQSAMAGRSQSVLRRRGDYTPRYAFEVLSRASAIRVHYARPIKIGDRTVGVLLLSRSPRALFRGIYDDLGKIAFGFFIIVFVIIGLAGLLSRAIAKPIEQLTQASAHVGRGGSEVPPTPATATIEIRALFDNFRRMAQQIDQRSRYLRDFAAAMSHEFKTPLTGIRGVLELLDEHGDTMSAAERRRFIANAEGDAERLSRLVVRLLELARADMGEADEAASTPAGEAVHHIADAQRTPDFAIETSIGPDLPEVSVPLEVLEAVLTTLIENSRQVGARKVTIAAAGVDGHLDLTVSDDGPGVPPGDRERLFEPFFTTRRGQGGTGLGLPIARSLLANSGSSIDFVDSAEGACFRLSLRKRE